MSTHSPTAGSPRASTVSVSKPESRRSDVTVTPISTSKPPDYKPTHHVNSPPTSFRNPWPSSPAPHSLLSILRARFLNNSERNFVPVPTDRSLLVPVRTPDWGAGDVEALSRLKTTWIGHASFMVEFPSIASNQRGIRILLDPVFSERMSPVSFLGPKRFTPPPCTLEELPEVDLVCISHNHYDHLDAATIKFIHARGHGRVKFMCALGVGVNLAGMGIARDEIVEMDWWDGVAISVLEEGVQIGELKVVCTPSQHNSGRGINDHGKALWCSFVLEEVLQHQVGVTSTDVNGTETNAVTPKSEASLVRIGKKLFFAGDTAYRAVPQGATEEDISKLPVCTAFQEVGELFGPFDMGLLPIGCYSPRWWMSAVHCAPEDSICIHQDIKSRRSIGMHYGTLRGGISQYYEEVTEPPRRWKECCEKAGLKWNQEIGLSDIGETILV